MKKQGKILIIVVLVVMVLVIIGVSYAVFNYSALGTKVNTITTGAITMTYVESSNTISLNGALPTTDKTGKVRLNQGEYFDFTVSSEILGNTNINYEISAKEVGDGTIDGSNIKLYLTKLNSDGTEEDLMVPEVYSEETSANNYTGRPRGEMSLYTSSMSSSESNTYRLRMWVDEVYNPQGDGGNLTFSVQVNVYGLDGDKYVPETTTTLLANNPLQEGVTNMFNYTANGRQYLNNTLGEVDDAYITNGLYSMEDEDGVSYYFRGTNVNNYVQFGEYTEDYYVYRYNNYDYITLESCQNYNGSCSEANRILKYSAGTPMYWRIVRVNGDGSLRLIYNGTSTSAEGQDLMIGIAAYNFNDNDPKYTGYTYDKDTNETDSNTKKDIEIWYSDVFSGTSYDREIVGGRFCSDSSGYQPGVNYGFSFFYPIFAGYDRLGQTYSNFAKANAPTLICPDTDETYGGSYRLKVGLITADELALSGMTAFGSDINSSYLSSSSSYWSMSPLALDSFGIYVYCGYRGLASDSTASRRFLRPVINVTADNGFTSGDGTALSPYVITAE